MVSVPQEMASGARRAAEVHFALILSRVLGSVSADPAQLRNIVYELAQIKLQKEVLQKEPPINPLETRHLTLALESAIERVEAIHSEHDDLKPMQSLDRLTDSSEVMIKPRKPVNRPSGHTLDTDRWPNFSTPGKGRSWTLERSWFWPGAAPLLRGATVAILAFALSFVLDRQFGLFGSQASQTVAPVVHKIDRVGPKQVAQAPGHILQSTTTPQSQSLGFPIPSVYGIYAVSGGQLHELEPLVGRVPDQRVFLSTPIKTPSRTVLPDGRIEFIVYRRDAANNAPDRITVRVIAKILRAMTFNSGGQASTTNVEDSWAIRNVSYDFRVAPLGENSEMLVIRPENVGFIFPAGRYGLVIKGQAYDFSVAGPITEAAQCLEGIKAENGTFYSECRRVDERPITSASRR
jgi:hypothetical protein